LKLKRKSDPFHQSIKVYLRKYFGVKPKAMALYEVALTHRSVYQGRPGLDNERLEFLGDRVLDAVIAHELYEKFSGESEGELTQRKSKMVNRAVLSAMAIRSGLDKLLIYQSGRDINVETLSGNALEAVIGAIYLEKGFDRTYKAVTRKLLPTLLDDDLISAQHDYKSELMIYAQKRREKLVFSMVEHASSRKEKTQFEVSVVLEGELLASAMGSSRKKAEQAAAKAAFLKLTAPSL
jgi:ribonuclease III